MNPILTHILLRGLVPGIGDIISGRWGRARAEVARFGNSCADSCACLLIGERCLRADGAEKNSCEKRNYSAESATIPSGFMCGAAFGAGLVALAVAAAMVMT